MRAAVAECKRYPAAKVTPLIQMVDTSCMHRERNVDFIVSRSQRRDLYRELGIHLLEPTARIT